MRLRLLGMSNLSFLRLLRFETLALQELFDNLRIVDLQVDDGVCSKVIPLGTVDVAHLASVHIDLLSDLGSIHGYDLPLVGVVLVSAA